MNHKEESWIKKAEAWMDKLNIYDLAMLNDIVAYKVAQERKRAVLERERLVDEWYKTVSYPKLVDRYFKKMKLTKRK